MAIKSIAFKRLCCNSFLQPVIVGDHIIAQSRFDCHMDLIIDIISISIVVYIA
jgi:hypothetical protein